METKQKSVSQRCRDTYKQVIFTRAELRERGASGRDITAAVRSGELIRLRRDRYAVASISDDVAEAVRIGGVLSCLSLLKSIGVFVLTCTHLHVHIQSGSSRLRPPKEESTSLHWNSVFGGGTHHVAGLQDAVREAIVCQTPRPALATMDSVVHHGLLTKAQLADVIATLPRRFSVLLSLVDASAETGPETFMRLILRGLGLQFETQVYLPGVGRVDFIVEGWLIIECDSREFHEGWKKQVEDRHRDTAAAQLGYVTLRPLASEIMHDAARVRASLAAVVEVLDPIFTGRGVHNSSKNLRSQREVRRISALPRGFEEL